MGAGRRGAQRHYSQSDGQANGDASGTSVTSLRALLPPDAGSVEPASSPPPPPSSRSPALARRLGRDRAFGRGRL